MLGRQKSWRVHIRLPIRDPIRRIPFGRLRAFECMAQASRPDQRRRRSRARAKARRAVFAAGRRSPGPCGCWQLAGEPDALRRLADLLSSADVTARQRAAFALRWLQPGDRDVLRKLENAADAEPPASAAWPFLLSAALTLNADPARAPSWRAELERPAAGISADARFEISQALMPGCTAARLRIMAAQLEDPDNNTRVNAAWTILYAHSHSISSAP